MAGRMKAQLPETAIARPVVAWLTQHGWDVYQEVPYGGRAADIVAIRGPLLYVVEVKRSLSLEVLGQAEFWTRYAHHAAVAVASSRHRDEMGRRVCDWLGLGLVTVDVPEGRVTEKLSPHLRRNVLAQRLTAVLRPEHKTACEAGAQSGHRWTPFAQTCAEVQRVVKENPGQPVSKVIERLKTHHYASKASARSSLAHWIQEGKVPGVEARREGKVLTLWPR